MAIGWLLVAIVCIINGVLCANGGVCVVWRGINGGAWLYFYWLLCVWLLLWRGILMAGVAIIGYLFIIIIMAGW